MLKLIYRSTVATLLLAVILCGVYPLAVTVVGRLLFKDKADGGIIVVNGKAVGAQLIGQAFTKPEYFHGRPSSAGSAPSAPNGYDASNSSGSNLGPTNQKFVDGLKSNVDAFLKDNPEVKKGEIPTDLVTASASGLDPHISPEAAYVQVSRVAKARGMDAAQVRKLVDDNVEAPQLGIFGEKVVNVLQLNLALDSSKH
jgi:K+-transporting ATPase ATPase C chain